MKLSQFKEALQSAETFTILKPEGEPVAAHFHITEAGLTTKHFIDCGGTIRKESAVSMQLWTANDYHHRLKPKTVLKILEKASSLFEGMDPEIQVEFQNETVGIYGLEFDGESFRLIRTETDCLALQSSESSAELCSGELISGCCLS